MTTFGYEGCSIRHTEKQEINTNIWFDNLEEKDHLRTISLVDKSDFREIGF